VAGTAAGGSVGERKPKDASITPRRAREIQGVTQIDVLEQHSILLVLTDKTLYSYPLEALSPDAGQPGISKRGRKITHANFFKSGVCQGQQLVCCVKTSALSSTIRVYEPMDSMTKKSKKSGIAKMLAGNEDVLKPFKVGILVSLVTIYVIFFMSLQPLTTHIFSGVLHPHRVLIHPLLTLQALRRLCSRFRNRLARNARSAIATRPSRHVPRLCAAQGRRLRQACIH
jgi:hypothetical protein